MMIIKENKELNKKEKMEDKIILDKNKKIDLLVKENNCLKEKNREY